MKLQDVKKSLFGYNKSDVDEYIAKLNSDHDSGMETERESHAAAKSELIGKNEALYDMVRRLEGEKEELKKQVQAGEAEIGRLKQALQAYEDNLQLQKKTEAEIARMREEGMQQALQYARTLREKADAEDYALREQRRRQGELEKLRLEKYAEEVTGVKNMVLAVMSRAQADFDTLDGTISGLRVTETEE